MNLVLQTGPEIHGNRAYLYLHFRIYIAVGQIDRHCDDHMVALITACFGKGNIILYGNDFNVPLLPNHIGNTINIGRKRAYDADAGYIVYIPHHIVDGRRITVTFQLLDNTLRGLDASLDMFNRVILMYMLKFIVEDFHSSLNLAQRRIINQCDLFPTVNSIPIVYF